MATQARSVQIKGLDSVLRHLKKLNNPTVTLDRALRQTAEASLGELQRATLSKGRASQTFRYGKQMVTMQNLSTGDTARAWTNPIKIANGYALQNAKRSGKYLIAQLIDEGRKKVQAKKGKALYLPLSRKGANKPPKTIDRSLRIGKDFILVKKIRAVKGTHYLDTISTKGSRYLTTNIINEIRGALAS